MVDTKQNLERVTETVGFKELTVYFFVIGLKPGVVKYVYMCVKLLSDNIHVFWMASAKLPRLLFLP